MTSGPESFYRYRKLDLKRAFRKNMTPAEEVLWNALRGRRLHGTKWRRQADIDRFIADFLCPKYRLIVEVDGGIHEQQQEYDLLRTKIIADHDYQILRFKNDEVLHQLQSVLRKISEYL